MTGSATWLLVALQQWLLGIRPDYDGLRIDPHLPSDLYPSFHVVRKFRGNCYDIRVDNRQKEKTLYVDGKPLSGRFLPYEAKEGTIFVELR